MDELLSKLVEELGEAIHDSVADSELIAGVVQKIRTEGYDVLLMLEATIALHTVDAEEAKEEAAAGVEEKEGFTAQDVHFLKSLRIAVEADTGKDTSKE